MAEKTGIEWCDATWNILVGCTKATMPGPEGKPVLREGCRNCYAIRESARPRLQQFPQYRAAVTTGSKPEWTGEITLVKHKLDWPLRKRKPLKIFVNAFSDLFHETVPNEWLQQIFSVMTLAKQHTFMILTKRPEQMLRYCAYTRFGVAPPKNVWLGVSIEDQASADYSIPLLLQTPAAVRWISAEPLLGQVSLERWVGNCEFAETDGEACASCQLAMPIHWVVAGGESGPQSRKTHPDWARLLREECAYAGIPFFFKQWGEWFPAGQDGPVPRHVRAHPVGEMDWKLVGKKAAGALLDGREWREWPKVGA